MRIFILFLLLTSTFPLFAQRINIKGLSILPERYENLIVKTKEGNFLACGIGTKNTLDFIKTKRLQCDELPSYAWVAQLSDDAEVLDQLLICVKEGEIEKISIAEGQNQSVYVAMSGHGTVEINGTSFNLPGEDNLFIYKSSTLLFKVKDFVSVPETAFLVEKSKFQDIKADSEGYIYLAGNYYGECIMNGEHENSTGIFQDESNQYLLKLNQNLKLIWKKIFATQLYSLSMGGPVKPYEFPIHINLDEKNNLWYYANFRIAITTSGFSFQLPEPKTDLISYNIINTGHILLKINPGKGIIKDRISIKNRYDIGGFLEDKEGNIHFFPENMEAMLNNGVVYGSGAGLHGLIVNQDTFNSASSTYYHLMIDKNGEITVTTEFDHFSSVNFHQILNDGSILLTYHFADWNKDLDNEIDNLLRSKGLDYSFYLIRLYPDGTPMLIGESYWFSNYRIPGVFIDSCYLYGISHGAHDSFGIKDYPFPTSKEGYLMGTYFLVADMCSQEEFTGDLFPPEIFIPNSFSPNGDGLNDVFEWNTISISESKIKIYSREGGRVVYSGGPGWDGTFKDKPAPEGMYGYALEAVTTNGKAIKKTGTIVLVR